MVAELTMQQAQTAANAHSTLISNLAFAVVLVLLGFQVRTLVRRWRSPLSARAEQAIRAETGPALKDMPAATRFWNGALRTTLYFGIFSLLILAMLVFGGRYQTDSHHMRTDMLLLFVGYVVGSAALGGILGLLAPWMQRRITAVAAGVLAVLPMFIFILASFDDATEHWTRTQTITCMVLSVILGAPLGLYTRRAHQRADALRAAASQPSASTD